MGARTLVTGAAGRVGAVGRTITELLLQQGQAVRAMGRNEDQRIARRQQEEEPWQI
jgi:nucleoside-diphosphate-sugar epimerase